MPLTLNLDPAITNKAQSEKTMDNETYRYIEGLSRNQTLLLPKTIEEYDETINPVRFTDSYVNTH